MQRASPRRRPSWAPGRPARRARGARSCVHDAVARKKVPTTEMAAIAGENVWNGSTARDAAGALVRVRDVGRARHSARMLEAVRALHRAIRVQVEHQRPARAGPDSEPGLHRDAGPRRKRYDVAIGGVRHSMASRSKGFGLDRDAANGRRNQSHRLIRLVFPSGGETVPPFHAAHPVCETWRFTSATYGPAPRLPASSTTSSYPNPSSCLK